MFSVVSSALKSVLTLVSAIIANLGNLFHGLECFKTTSDFFMQNVLQ